MWSIFTPSRQLQRQVQDRWQRLYRVAYSWCHDPQLASDLTQETIAKALHKSHQLKKAGALDAWLFSILNNCWRDYCRSSKDDVEFNEVALFNEISQGDENERAHVITRVRHAIARLQLEQRQVVTLVDLEGMTYSEVADVLDIPIGTVMSRLCRARRQLKEFLRDFDSEPRSSAPRIWRIK
jgi:RNA polymerase sigma-70 factor (ECF subfamily)